VLAEPPYDDREGDWIIEAYARRLEQEIRSSPADWLWVHNKWKYPKPVETQPPRARTVVDNRPQLR
jgi:lauroyl/myristoyl acyltransferase